MQTLSYIANNEVNNPQLTKYAIGLIYEDLKERVYFKNEGINRAISVLSSKDAISMKQKLIISKRELIEVIEFNDDQVCFDESRVIERERRTAIS